MVTTSRDWWWRRASGGPGLCPTLPIGLLNSALLNQGPAHVPGRRRVSSIRSGPRRPGPSILSTVEPGNLAEWLAAIFTGAGFGAAVFQLRQGRIEAKARESHAYEQEVLRREAMARAVGVSVIWDQPNSEGLAIARTEIVNAGPYPISTAVLRLVADGAPYEVVIGTILPGQHLTDQQQVPRAELSFGEITYGATLLFTDTYGEHWARTGDSLERRDTPPRLC